MVLRIRRALTQRRRRNCRRANGVAELAWSRHAGYATFMSEVTHILSAIEHGDPHAAEQLLPLVYDELRKLAAQQLAQEKPGQTLDATGLVHESYLRLVGDRQFASRRHFFAAAAEAMRLILIDNARRKATARRGGGRRRVTLVDVQGLSTAPDELSALDDSLTPSGTL